MEEDRRNELKEMDTAELFAEKDEIIGSISNEKIWQRGCDRIEDELDHQENIDLLFEELDYVNELLAGR